MIKNKLFKLIILASFITLSVTHSEATTLVVDSATNKLLGATDVLVSNIAYDVFFREGTLDSVFGDGSGGYNFDFTTRDTAKVAGDAILASLFVDVAQGRFDSDPELTVGIFLTKLGAAYIPVYLETDPYDGYVRVTTIINYSPEFISSVKGHVLSQHKVIADFDTGLDGGAVWADFSLSSAAPVPEPSTFMLLGIGLLGMARINRKRISV